MIAFAHLHNLVSAQGTREMPVCIDNALPCFKLALFGFILLVLYDSGASVNTGNFAFHVLQMKLNPESVFSFEQFNDANPFNPLKLIGAVTDPSTMDPSIFNDLIAIIRYIYPHPSEPNKTIIVAFALGRNVSVNSILGLPTIKQLGFAYDPTADCITSSYLHAKFPVFYQKPAVGLPSDHSDFDANAYLASPEFTALSERFQRLQFHSQDKLVSGDCLKRSVHYSSDEDKA